MSEQQQTVETSQSGADSAKTGRSASYPNLIINEAYDFTKEIYDQLAHSEFSREVVAHALGKHAQTIARDIAACVQYGFLVKATEGYKISDLMFELISPQSEKEKKINFLKAFAKPKLYSELINEFDGKPLPEGLHNTLYRKHNIMQAASKTASDTFIESARFVGAIADNRILKYSIALSVLEKTTQFAEIEEIPAGRESDITIKSNVVENHSLIATLTNSTQLNPLNIANQDIKEIPIHLTKGKTAYFRYPASITEKDVKIIQHVIEGILLQITFDSDEVNEE